MNDHSETIWALFDTIQRRKRPEDVAHMVLDLLGDRLSRSERRVISKAAMRSVKSKMSQWTSMMEDFARPVGMARQVSVARELFGVAESLSAAQCSEPAAVEEFLRMLNDEIRKRFGAADFKADRLNREQRAMAGLGEMSKRRYNKLFRLLGRMEKKLETMLREQRKYEFTRIGKSGLATRLDFETFASNHNSAAFIAYFVARSNLRSEFTGWGQKKPFDEIAKMLFDRCLEDQDANFWAIAHVFSHRDVLMRLSDRDKGELLGAWFGVLEDVSGLLREVWQGSQFNRSTMIVRRGNDSTTWNNTANAWNKARKHWIELLWVMGLDAMLDTICPGKVLRLIAADVAAWHRSLGHGLDPDTAVWAELPLPWEVLGGGVECNRQKVRDVCARHGLDPDQRGWLQPAPLRVEAYTPTPELVHGVAVSSPALARTLRSAGWFSGKSAIHVADVEVHRDGHGFALVASEPSGL